MVSSSLPSPTTSPHFLAFRSRLLVGGLLLMRFVGGLELEERDVKRYPLEDSDLENGTRTKTIDLVPETEAEDDQESTRTADTGRKPKGLESPSPVSQGWEESREGSYVEERRGVTFSPDTAAGSREERGGVFVSYLGTPNVRVLHADRQEGK